jgi:hypothetical protein
MSNARTLRFAHTDAHFVLVTEATNPTGTTHRDHFERGRRSFFAISLELSKSTALLHKPTHQCAARHSLSIIHININNLINLLEE